MSVKEKREKNILQQILKNFKAFSRVTFDVFMASLSRLAPKY
jgi:hypothetical protein